MRKYGVFSRRAGAILQLMWHRGDVVRKLREAQGWSQQALAKRASLSERSVARAENNEPTVSMDVWHQLATALGTTVDEVDKLLSATTTVTPVTGSVTITGHRPTAEVAPVPDTPKARLIHLVYALSDEQAAVLFPLVLQWFAKLIGAPSATREPPPRK